MKRIKILLTYTLAIIQSCFSMGIKYEDSSELEWGQMIHIIFDDNVMNKGLNASYSSQKDISVDCNTFRSLEAMCQISRAEPNELNFLTNVAQSVLKTSTVAPGVMTNGFKNTLGFRAITPGGYRAIWVQDFTMNFSSGLVSREDGLNHLNLILTRQNGPHPVDLGNGVIIPPYAIADHINLDGQPVFFPGTLDPNANMEGKFGFRPPSNNQYDVIWLTHMLSRNGDAKKLLSDEVQGVPIYERLKLAFEVPEIDPVTQLIRTTDESRAVGFIFYDVIYMTGDLLMASLIRYRTALQMAWLAKIMGNAEDIIYYNSIAQKIRINIVPVFGNHDESGGGWLRASTGVSGQPDVWGSIFAIYVGAVEGDDRKRLLHTITNALQKESEIEFQGALRHVPVSYDASPTSAWEQTDEPKNRYMNGAYWHTPLGWLLNILQSEYPDLADTLKKRWLNFLLTQDKKVWECIGWKGKANKNSSFAPSITLPLGVLKYAEAHADQLHHPEHYLFP